jgi:hypothetical protein
VFLRDLAAGTNILVTDKIADTHMDVTPNGRAVFNLTPPPFEVLQFDSAPPPGQTTTLTSSAPLWSMEPVSDGINVVFKRAANALDPPVSIVLRTAAGVEEVLATGLPGATARSSYRAAGGWTAFVRKNGESSFELWPRKPDGMLRPLSSDWASRSMRSRRPAGSSSSRRTSKGRDSSRRATWRMPMGRFAIWDWATVRSGRFISLAIVSTC